MGHIKAAGPETCLDLVLQTGPGTIVKLCFPAFSQLEYAVDLF